MFFFDESTKDYYVNFMNYFIILNSIYNNKTYIEA